MYLENLVFDCRDQFRPGRFWADALGATEITNNDDGYEARLTVGDDLYLDLCFGPPTEPVRTDTPRLHLDLLGGDHQQQVVERLLTLGATRRDDPGDTDLPWTVLRDPEGNPFCVMEDRPEYRRTGPIAAIPIDSSDPRRDADFYAEFTGWRPAPGHRGIPSLRHPSGVGPLLEFCEELAPKDQKNQLHLDVRRESADPPLDELIARVTDLGGALLEHDWGELPWTVFVDPSGNEFCILPASD